MPKRLAQIAAALVVLSAASAAAQELDSGHAPAIAPAFAVPVSHYPMPGAPIGDRPQARPAFRFDTETRRPAILLPLYVTAATLQGLDVYTTYRGIHGGARETNALVRGGNAGTTLALKAATTGLGIAIAEKMWRRNKAAAIASMIVTNAVTASVVANNYRVLNRAQ